ncbi:MAG TPA: ChaN family lipoprotein [Haliscomenobacter sp.]|uniref:ChaN family lipoprotein n=1 Tax=Haliscomenobacter sp. TaxID=2717303 RepID=UPI002C4BE11B|nr:ChaN family lipoprotein [Haliscomenobacter sp.]HOY16079.1 ChaN family lipoprotein [Haliscomenobacter sp.]
MKPILCICLLSLASILASAQDKPAYRLFDQSGKEVSYGQMLKSSKKADVVFFGEQHNNPISHWLQIELAQDLEKESNGKLIMGAEMFERDNQAILTEYLNGQISTKNFEEEARVWDNYATDYKPLVELAKSKKLSFIATNVPRRYANMVYKQGIESLNPLTSEAKSWIAPLPIEVDMNLPSYQAMAKMMGGHGGEAATTNLVKSQAVKDATMGYFIAQNLKKGHVFLHFNGAYHSDLKEGTVWYVRKYAPGKDIVTISTVEQDNIDKLDEENLKKADFIICVPAKMTKTY